MLRILTTIRTRLGISTASVDQKSAEAFLIAFALLSVFYGLYAQSSAASLIIAAVLAFATRRRPKAHQISLSLLAASGYLIGPLAPLAATVLFIAQKSRQGAILTTALGILTVVYSPHVVANLSFERALNFGSLGFSILPYLATIVVLSSIYRWTVAFRLSLGSFLTITIIWALGASGQIPPQTFTHPFFGWLVASLPALSLTGNTDNQIRKPKNAAPKSLGAAIITPIVLTVLIITIEERPIEKIIFDEAHGTWESVEADFTPQKYGRNVYYQYSELKKWASAAFDKTIAYTAEKIPQTTNAMFVLKMPTQDITPAYQKKLWKWVKDGGRLLVVADHTNLYDTTRRINNFLSNETGLKIAETAVFNSTGMPNKTTTPKTFAAFGRIDATGSEIAYQTGASFAHLPLTAIPIATYGPSFAEPADYSRQNRFGTFTPRLQLPYGPHPSIVAQSVGIGQVIIITDSTPWSNFSIGQATYQDLFTAITNFSTNPTALRTAAYSAIAILVCTIFGIFFLHPGVQLLLTAAIAVFLSSASYIGIKASSQTAELRENFIRVVPGKEANLEYLDQLVPVGERNYSRIVASLGKFNLPPRVYTNKYSSWGSEPKSSSTLFIEPTDQHLPRPEDVYRSLKKEENLTFLFDEQQVTNSGVMRWITDLGLTVRESRSLAYSEDSSERLIDRDRTNLFRMSFPITSARPSSLLVQVDKSTLLQTYTLRAANGDSNIGTFTVGFVAEQFSDSAIGDIWEGVIPNAISPSREKELAQTFDRDTDFQIRPPPTFGREKTYEPTLRNFLALQNGSELLRGTLPATVITHSSDSLGLDPYGYLSKLQENAHNHLKDSCETKGSNKECENLLIGPGLTEWRVIYRGRTKQPSQIELIHERAFSGLTSTYNVIFSNE